MPPKRYVPAVLILAAVLAVAWLTRHQWAAAPAKEPVSLEQRLALELPALAAWEVNYVPTLAGRLDDLSLDATALLSQLPGVATVHTNDMKNPTVRIVHFLDYHFVEQEDLAGEFPHADAVQLSRLHQEVLLKVELIQADQLAALRSLVKYLRVAALSYGEFAGK